MEERPTQHTHYHCTADVQISIDRVGLTLYFLNTTVGLYYATVHLFSFPRQYHSYVHVGEVCMASMVAVSLIEKVFIDMTGGI